MGRLSSVFPRAPIEYESQLMHERITSLPLIDNGPFSETFQICAAEFANDFYSFVLDDINQN
jgi:hypothetical protein